MMGRSKRQQAARRAQGRARDALDRPVPLPIRGMYDEALEAEMSGQFAGELTNCRSTGTLIETRVPIVLIADASDIIQTVPYEFAAAKRRLLITPTSISDSASSFSRTFSGPASVAYISSHAIIADGAGLPVSYNGSAFQYAGFTTSTGKEVADFDGVIAHHDRPYFWDTEGALEFYYADQVGAVTGVLSRFPLDRLGNITGQITEMGSWTVDAGHGMNDVLAIFTSSGQMVAYEGLDPGDPQDWRLLSRIVTAEPVGQNCIVTVGSDAWFLSKQGVVSLSKTLRQGAVALVERESRPVSESLRAAIAQGGTWQMHLAADASRMVINRVYKGASEQWIYEIDGMGWSRADYPAQRWYNINGQTRFVALDGGEYRLDATATGDEITATLITTWLRTGGTGISWIKPMIRAKGSVTLRVAVFTDHDDHFANNDDHWQEITLEADAPMDAGEIVSLDDVISVAAEGAVYQIRMEVTAPWAQIVSIRAGLL